MEGGLVTRRRIGDELVLTFAGQVVAVLRLTEVSSGAVAFDLQLPPLGLGVGIGVETGSNSAAVQIVAPRALGVFREELLRDKLPRDHAA